MARFGIATRENDFFVDQIKSSSGKYSGVSFVVWEKYSENNSRITISLDYSRTSEKVKMVSFYSEVDSQAGEGIDQTSMVTYDNSFFRQILQLYMLPQILIIYGAPTEVLILPYYDNPFNPADFVVPFSLILYYEEQGIYIEYLFPREGSGSFYRGCPSKAGILILKTWDPESDVNLEEIVNDNSVGINGLKFTKSIADASSLTLVQFYQTFGVVDNRACIETPIGLWNLEKSPAATP